jgi:hypothetical protein
MLAKASIQEGLLKPLDSGFRRHDDKGRSVLIQSFPNAWRIGKSCEDAADLKKVRRILCPLFPVSVLVSRVVPRPVARRRAGPWRPMPLRT